MAVYHEGLAPRWPQLAVPDAFDKPLMQPERGPATADAAAPPRVVVDVNTLVVRTDLGSGRYTYVAAHTKVPIGLEGFARIPA
jgi:hypothetical protein